MSERPILFSGPMVRAILDGRKTQTRRVVKLPVVARNYEGCEIAGCELDSCLRQGMDLCPHGQPGDALWVRETTRGQGWSPTGDYDYYSVQYQADNRTIVQGVAMTGNCKPLGYPKWTPSIHMPRWACRLTLKVTGVRVERLQDISAKDILAEGAVTRPHHCEHFGKMPVSAFDGKAYTDLKSLWAAGWNSINAKRGYGWNVNPWVWVIEFQNTHAKDGHETN